jgi:hypothetical protein
MRTRLLPRVVDFCVSHPWLFVLDRPRVLVRYASSPTYRRWSRAQAKRLRATVDAMTLEEIEAVLERSAT